MKHQITLADVSNISVEQNLAFISNRYESKRLVVRVVKNQIIYNVEVRGRVKYSTTVLESAVIFYNGC